MAMSFKCSVFGHAYEDSEIEREREEDGSEVVTTIRETQTCKRCGETRVVSENKEVTTLETAADIVADDLGEGESPDEQIATTADADSEHTETASPDLAEEPESTTPAASVGGPESETSEATAAESAGGEIIDAETGTGVDEEGESTPEPATETDPATDDGVILDEESEAEEPDREPGEWPDEPDDGDDEWRPETEVDPTPETDKQIEPTGNAVTVPEGEFHCPECEFTTPVEESSLRRGDFCPECHRGSLEHVTE